MKKASNKPNKFASWILEHLIPGHIGQSGIGDYEELYGIYVNKYGRFSANQWYLRQILKSFILFLFDSTFWRVYMFKNYLLITFRNLKKHKVYSVINITGIALSIAICLIIIIYIRDWRSADQFHANKDRIFRIYTTDTNTSWDVDGWATTPGYLAPHLLQNYPDIEDALRLRRMGLSVLFNNTAIYVGGFYAESSFFDVFDFKLKAGDPKTALKNPFSIVLSEEYAHTFFGDEDPIGKILTVEKKGNFTVTGILKEINEKTHLNFKSLASFSTINSLAAAGLFENELNDWKYMSRYYTYLMINDTENIAGFEQQLPEMENFIIPEDKIERFGFDLENICDINLGKNMSNQTPGTKSKADLIFVPFLAVIIVFLVCFNYVILSIARSLKRSKEIGLRKVIGSKRSQIIKLFLSEAFVITFLALITACVFVLCLVPVFNNMDVIENAGEQINLEMMKDPGIYVDFFLVAIAISLLAGLYPALYLSSIRPLNALQGISRIKGFSHLITRKILMGIQFAVSLISIIFILYFFQLFGFIKSVDRNVAFDNCVNVYLGEVNYETFRNEISRNSMFTGVSFSEVIPLYGEWQFLNIKTEDMVEPLRAFYFNGDMEFMDNFELELIAGRNFSGEFTTDAGKAVIVNEKTASALGFDSPEKILGKVLNDDGLRVIGVVKDFTHRIYLENPIIPTVLIHWPKGFRYANIRYLPENEDKIKASLPEIWKEFDKVHPGMFSFSNDALKEYEMNNTGIVTIFTWVTGLIVLIALFGLLGMTAYTTELRVKEIGIRKVFGASSRVLVYQLTKSYMKLIIITCIIVLPIGYKLSDLVIQWLYVAIRPSLSLWVLPAAMLFILLLTFMTTGFLTRKAVNANPVDTLREE
ncbi:ABC transporter permease [candidate division KSB1 bacterium]